MSALVEWTIYAGAWGALFRRNCGCTDCRRTHNAAIDIIQEYVDG